MAHMFKKILPLCLICFLVQSQAQTLCDTLDVQMITLTSCENDINMGEGTFDLQSAQSDLLPGATSDIKFDWFEDVDTSLLINNIANYSSPTDTVFVRITSSLDTTCSILWEVPLVVLYSPDLGYVHIEDDRVCGSDHPLFSHGSESGNFSWSPGFFFEDSTLSNPVFLAPYGDTTYTITVTAWDSSLQCVSQRSVSFEFFDVHFEITGDDHLYKCQPDSLTILNSETSDVDAMIQWSSDRGHFDVSTGQQVEFNTLRSSYVYASQIFDNGCILSDTVFVQVDSLPQFDLEVIPGPSEPCMKYCPGTKVSLTTQAPDKECYPDVKYQWTPMVGAGGDMREDTTLNVVLVLTNDNSQTYMRLTTNNACRDTVSHRIEVVDTIPTLSGQSVVCRGDHFRVTIDTAYLADNDFTDISWNIDSDYAELNCGDCKGATEVEVEVMSDAQAGVINVTVRGLKEQCCTATGSFQFRVDVPTIAISVDDYCHGEPVAMTAQDGFTDYQWTSDGGTSLSPSDQRSTILTGLDQDGQIAQVNVTAINEFGCMGEGSRTLRLNQLTVTRSPAVDSLWTEGDILYLFGTLLIPEEGEIVWVNSANDETQVGAGVNFSLVAGVNTITATFTSEDGCVYTWSETFHVQLRVHWPNVFAPSDMNNEANQVFRPLTSKGGQPLDATYIQDFKIFNRWGQVVYDNDSNDRGWNGRQDGELAPSDVYIYKAEIRAEEGFVQTFTGDVTLLR